MKSDRLISRQKCEVRHGKCGIWTVLRKKRCRSLWEEAFPEDSASFVDYYMEEKDKGQPDSGS